MATTLHYNGEIQRRQEKERGTFKIYIVRWMLIYVHIFVFICVQLWMTNINLLTY